MDRNIERAEEARVRRLAARQGYAIRKDRARSTSLDHQGGYMVVDPWRNVVIAGQRFDLTLEDLRQLLAPSA